VVTSSEIFLKFHNRNIPKNFIQLNNDNNDNNDNNSENKNDNDNNKKKKKIIITHYP